MVGWFCWVILIGVLLLPPPVNAEASSPQDHVIKVGIYQHEPAMFTTADGVVRGFLIDLLVDAASRNQWRLQYLPGTWSQSLERLKTGEIDLLPGVAYDPEWERQFDFTTTTAFSNWAHVYVRNEKVDSLLQLDQMTITGLPNHFYTLHFRALLENLDIKVNFIERPTFQDVLQYVVDGKADAAIMPHDNRVMADQTPALFQSPITCCVAEIRYATRAGKNAGLLKTLDHHLAWLKKEPTSLYYQSFSHWLENADTPQLPDWHPYLTIVAGGLGLLFFARNAELRRQLQKSALALEREAEKGPLVQGLLSQQEAALQAAQERTQTVNRSKNAFLANLRHEMRSPLNTITHMTGLILAGPLSREQRNHLEVVQRAGESLLALTRTTRDLSRVEDGKFTLDRVGFDFRNLVENSCETLACQTHEKGLSLFAHIAPEIPATLEGDPRRLGQVLVTLLGDALRRTGGGDLILRVRPNVEPGIGAEDILLLITVAVTGVALPADFPVSTAPGPSNDDGETNPTQHHTTPGLMLSEHVVSLMGGQIQARRDAGSGTLFSCNVRLGIGHRLKPRADPLPERRSDITRRPSLTGVRVVIATSHELVGTILREMLTRFGAEVAITSDSALLKTVQLAANAEQPFHLLLLDHRILARDHPSWHRLHQHPGLQGPTLVTLPGTLPLRNLPGAARFPNLTILPEPVKRFALLQAINRLPQEKNQPNLTPEPHNQNSELPIDIGSGIIGSRQTSAE